ncbi:hypothetical protein PMAYCL1PPCAC_24943, partial [Pristionchus mayeri]
SLSVMENGEATAAAETEDGSRSGVIRFEVDNVSKLDTRGRYSPEVEVGGVPWKISVRKQGSNLGVFLASITNISTLWSIDVEEEIIIFNSDASKNVTSKIDKYPFQHNRSIMGKNNMLKWDQMIDKEEGFINDDKITVEIRFSISKMRGIRMPPHFDFTNPDEPNHDVAFIIDEEKIYANKILCVFSPVFYAMFHGEFAEKNKKE